MIVVAGGAYLISELISDDGQSKNELVLDYLCARQRTDDVTEANDDPSDPDERRAIAASFDRFAVELERLDWPTDVQEHLKTAVSASEDYADVVREFASSLATGIPPRDDPRVITDTLNELDGALNRLAEAAEFPDQEELDEEILQGDSIAARCNFRDE